MYQRTVSISIRISTNTGLVVIDHIVQRLHLVITVAGAGNAIFIVEVIDCKGSVTGTIKPEVTIVIGLTVWKIVQAISIIVSSIVVIISIVGLKSVDKLGNPSTCYILGVEKTRERAGKNGNLTCSR